MTAVSQPLPSFPATLAPAPCLPRRRESLDVVGFVQERQQEVYPDAYLASLPAVHQAPRKWFERLAWWWLLAGGWVGVKDR